MKKSRTEGTARTTVSLPRRMAARLSYEADLTGRAVSAVVRDALERYFAGQEEPPLPSFVGVGESGHGDTAERAEEIIGEIIEERFPPRRS